MPADPLTSIFPESRVSLGNTATVHTHPSFPPLEDLVGPGHSDHSQVPSGRAHDRGPARLERSGYRHHAPRGSTLGAGNE